MKNDNRDYISINELKKYLKEKGIKKIHGCFLDTDEGTQLITVNERCSSYLREKMEFYLAMHDKKRELALENGQAPIKEDNGILNYTG